MVYAVTHILGAILVLDIFRHYVFGKDKFPRYLLVVGGIAGLGPDIDIVFGWVVSLFNGTVIDLHGLFTHSIFFALLFLVIGLICHYYKNVKWAKIFYVIAAGWTIHLLLDCPVGGQIGYLWPLSIDIYKYCPDLISG